MQNVYALSSVVQSANILSRTILFKGNLAQPRKYCPTKYLGYTVLWYSTRAGVGVVGHLRINASLAYALRVIIC